jgi:hypothetical protein
MTNVGAILALLRAGVGSATVETLRVPYAWLAGRLLVFAVLPAAMIVIVGYRLSPVTSLVSSDAALQLTALCVPHEMELMLPLAFFLTAMWTRRSRHLPVVGLSLIACLLTLAFNVWVEPGANQTFFRVIRAAGPREVMYPIIQMSPAGWTTSNIAQAAAHLPATLVFGFLAFKINLAFLSGALVLLGSAIAARGSVMVRRALIVAPAVYLGALYLIMAGQSMRPTYYPLQRALAPWWLASIALALLIALLHLSRARRWLLALPLVVVGVASLVLPDDWSYLYGALGGGLAPALVAAAVAFISIKLARAALRPEAQKCP